MDEHSRTLLGRSNLERRIRLVPRSLMVADLLGLSLAYLVSTLFWGGAGAFGSTKEMVVFVPPCRAGSSVAKLQGLYRATTSTRPTRRDDVVRVF